MIDDDPKILAKNKDLLDDETIPNTTDKIKVITCNDFEESLNEFDKERIDLVIVDLKKGPAKPGEDPELEAGEITLNQIRERKFLPVVFYTGWPHKVRHLEGPHVKIVGKPADPGIIMAAIGAALESPLPVVNRALITHLEKIQAGFMWGVADDIYRTYGNSVNPYDVAYLLARRISLSLSDEGIKAFLKDSGASADFYSRDSLVHPMQYYVIPPIEEMPLAGDIFFGKIDTTESYWCLLTPSCDLVPHKTKKQTKAEWIVFAKCVLLREQPEFINWYEEVKKTGKLDNDNYPDLDPLLKNNRRNSQAERFVFLPGVLDIPDLVIDFQQLKIGKIEILTSPAFKRKASIDPPYSDSILSKFARYFGRVGTPDLNCSCVISKYSGDSKTEIK
jgi:hypothetical protein